MKVFDMKTKYTIIAAALVCGISAMDAQKPLEFDAASLKPAQEAGPAGVASGKMTIFYSGCSGGPGTTDPGRFTCTTVTLRTLIQRAWRLGSNELAGPATLDSSRYDVEAKVPEGTTKEQFSQMLQTLITDRFHLVIHHEEREPEVHELTIAKGGHKLQVPQPGDTESPCDDLTNDSNGDGKAKKNDSDMDPKSAAMLTELRGQLTTMMAGRAGRAGERPPSHLASSTTNGLTRLAGRRATIADLTGFLSNQLGRLVTDHTQLTGEWNFLVEYASEGRMGNAGMTAAMSQLRQSMSTVDSTATPAEPSTPSGGPTMAAAFQKQLGLKLEATKGPADTIVVDRFDKTPAGN